MRVLVVTVVKYVTCHIQPATLRLACFARQDGTGVMVGAVCVTARGSGSVRPVLSEILALPGSVLCRNSYVVSA